MTGRVVVTATPPTPNGDLHVGHLAGPYLGADVFRRYRTARGDDVVFLTSTDDHQTYLERKAELRSERPEETVGYFAEKIRRTLSLAAIDVDAFPQPVTSTVHDLLVGSLFRRLVEGGVVRPRETPAFRCEPCGRILVDYDCRGRCGNCGEACDVGICEECGHPSSPLSLAEPRCTRCGVTPVLTSITRLCLDLEEHRAALEGYHGQSRSRRHTRRLWEELAAHRLPVVAVAHPGSWGIPCDVAGFEAHRWWGMAEMGFGYVATAQALAEARGEADGWHTYWSEHAEIIQFFGFDNSYWQTVIHPTLFLASGLPVAEQFVVNEFYLLDGFKFSSSKDHAVWGAELLEVVPPDVLRYYVSVTAPEQAQTNFTLAEFAATANKELATDAQRALTTLLTVACSDDGNGAGTLTNEAVAAARRIGDALEPATFSLERAMRIWHTTLMELAASAVAAAAGDAVAALTVMASAAGPVMPAFASRLWTAVRAPGDVGSHPWATPALASARSIAESALAEQWFPEVDIARLNSGTVPVT
jgi:methionyl-tRNA synthetase